MLIFANVNRLVTKLTDNEALRTYYTLLLMAETDASKSGIDNRFWNEFDALPEFKQKTMKEELKKVVKKLPELTADLRDRVVDFSEKNSKRQAACPPSVFQLKKPFRATRNGFFTRNSLIINSLQLNLLA